MLRLSKSDFKVARTCPTKLYYKKLRYPSRYDDDPYLSFLADGGFMVEKMAKLLFPDGIECAIDRSNPERVHEELAQALAGASDFTWFEPTVIAGPLLARVDVFQRVGSIIRLIEVKSSSVDTSAVGPQASPFRGARGGIESKWKPYLEDVTFQKVVLERAFPEFKVVPYLCVVDKARTASECSTFDRFELEKAEISKGFFSTEVSYTGDAASLRENHLLAIINVSAEAAELQEEVALAADGFADTLRGDEPVKLDPHLCYACNKCEYRIGVGETKNGFAECWGPLASVQPHILDLFALHNLGGRARDVVEELAAAGKASFDNIPEDAFKGKSAERQRIQIECVQKGSEFFDPNLAKELTSHTYPLHFIDFEGSRLAIPYHVGMAPYEQVGFQWSCHTIPAAGASALHGEWINTEDAFPNLEFAKSLRSHIGDAGTVYIWSPYEMTMLRDIRSQLDKYAMHEPELAEWLDWMTEKENPRVVDLCKLAKEYYLHPEMAGSVSIKAVLPAIWNQNPSLHEDPLLKRYAARGAEGRYLDPYQTLEPLPIGADRVEVVNEGTGAMRIYQEMMFGLSSKDPEVRVRFKQLLLQYCELDTAAMVAIWKHWVAAGSR